MEAFTEDWNASQFWYTDDTARQLAQQLLSRASKKSRIAVVSAPSVFLQLKNILAEKTAQGADEAPDIRLLEFDERFAVFKEFVQYDFEQPTKLPSDLRGQFDYIICDPPFLSEDCQTKAALTVRWLSKTWMPILEDGANGSQEPGLNLIVCTGERMESLIHKLYSKIGLVTTSFEVQHARGLSNEFRCYSNFKSDIWELREV
jgi:16S rRNA G966 N2-methylase RsmD